VPVATPVYCQVAKPDQPALPLSELKADSAPDDTIRAYAATVAILKGAVRERDLAIEGCAAPVNAQDPAPQGGGATPSGAATDVKMSPTNSDGKRYQGTGRASESAAVANGAVGLLRKSPHPARNVIRPAVEEAKRTAHNVSSMRTEVGVELRPCAAAAESPIGPSPGRHDFRKSAERKSRRPPSPRL